MLDRKILIQEMLKQRKTYAEIAKILDISKQRVHQIYKDYIPTSPEIKERIKKRDNRRCVLCGFRRPLEVHHINGIKRDNKKKNLVTLCRTCHLKIEWIRKRKVGFRKSSGLNNNAFLVGNAS